MLRRWSSHRTFQKIQQTETDNLGGRFEERMGSLGANLITQAVEKPLSHRQYHNKRSTLAENPLGLWESIPFKRRARIALRSWEDGFSEVPPL